MTNNYIYIIKINNKMKSINQSINNINNTVINHAENDLGSFYENITVRKNRNKIFENIDISDISECSFSCSEDEKILDTEDTKEEQRDNIVLMIKRLTEWLDDDRNDELYYLGSFSEACKDIANDIVYEKENLFS